MLAIARYLRNRGHSIIFNTAEVFRRQVEAANLRFIPFSEFANFDYRHLEEAFPERKNFKPGPDQLAYDFKTFFGKPIPHQYRRIRQIIEETTIDLIFTDVTWHISTSTLATGSPDARNRMRYYAHAPLQHRHISVLTSGFQSGGTRSQPARQSTISGDVPARTGIHESGFKRLWRAVNAGLLC
jgi:UDP:flavonoid glycosyltransferase YjiC (YdhE family)